MPGIGLEYLVVLGGLPVLIQQQPVKSGINLQYREMLEVLRHAVYGEHFFDEGFSGNDFGPFGYSAFVPVQRINLSDPAGISVTGRTYENLGMEIAEAEIIHLALRPGRPFCRSMLLRF